MTAATAARRRLAFDPDDYLDCRRAGWALYEDGGLIRFERPLGARTAQVLVDDDCIEVVAALQGRAHRRPPALTERLPDR
jgi:hypothetical protein